MTPSERKQAKLRKALERIVALPTKRDFWSDIGREAVQIAKEALEKADA